VIVTIKVRKEVEVKTLHVEAGVRYWRDANINGIYDTEGTLTPCKERDLWKPIIDVDSGQIINWEIGKTAAIHFKVCDAGSYYLKDTEGNTILSIEDDYVPGCLSPKDSGYGDYIIMDIDKDGFIQNWNPDLSEFGNDEEEH